MNRISILLTTILLFSFISVASSQEYNTNSSVKELQRGAKKGDPLAQFYLAICYEDGRGVRQDYETAARLFEKAAEQNIAPAQYNIALRYSQGKGVSKDLKKAAYWYRKAAYNGDTGFYLVYHPHKRLEH